MARIVIAGSLLLNPGDRVWFENPGAIGASIAYQLALRGADDVVLADRAQVASGSTGKAMGGVRQQFSTEAEVRLARASIGFFEETPVSDWLPERGSWPSALVRPMPTVMLSMALAVAAKRARMRSR